MRKNVLFNFILLVFLVIGSTLIITSNPQIVQADDGVYYLVDAESSYIIENKSNDKVTCDVYSKDNDNNYNKLKYGEIDALHFDADNKPEDCDTRYSSLEMQPGEKVQAGTYAKEPFYIKIPKTCKVTKKNESLWCTYELKKGKTVCIKNDYGEDTMENYGKGVRVCVFLTDKNKNGVTTDNRYVGSNNYSFAQHRSGLGVESMTYQHSLTVTAEYEDVQIAIPVCFRECISEVNHPVFKKFTLPCGKDIVMASNAKWFSDVYFDQKVDIIDVRGYRPVGIITSYEYERYGGMDSQGILGFYAGYGTDVDIYVPYEDNWEFFRSNTKLFDEYTLNPGDSANIQNDADERLLIKFINAEGKYYYTEKDKNTNEIIVTSTNPENDDFNSIYDARNVIAIKKGAYMELKNTSNSPFTIRFPNSQADLIASWNYDNIVEFSAVDLAYAAAHYNMTSESKKWDPKADYNHDGIIDIYDLSYVAGKLL